MARKVETIVHMTDDLDGSKADQTVSFTWDGTSYEIDLSKKNATALTKAIQPYLDAARKVSNRTAKPAVARARAKTPYDRADLIKWAEGKGYTVAQRGRVAQSIVDEYMSQK